LFSGTPTSFFSLLFFHTLCLAERLYGPGRRSSVRMGPFSSVLLPPSLELSVKNPRRASLEPIKNFLSTNTNKEAGIWVFVALVGHLLRSWNVDSAVWLEF